MDSLIIAPLVRGAVAKRLKGSYYAKNTGDGSLQKHRNTGDGS